MKKKTIYVVIAIAVVAILAIGFQTAPKTPAFDFESNPIVDVVTVPLAKRFVNLVLIDRPIFRSISKNLRNPGKGEL